MQAQKETAGCKRKAGDDEVVHKCIKGSLKASAMATTLLIVEKQDAEPLLTALSNATHQKHKWELKTDNVDITALPSWAEFYILQSVLDPLPASEPDILELVVRGHVSTLKLIVFQVRDGKRDNEDNAVWMTIETKTDKHCQDIEKELQNMMEEDGVSRYVGDGTIEITSRAEYRASEYYQRYHKYIKATDPIYDELMEDIDEDKKWDQDDQLRWLSS
jgi:hypothetical protein